MQQHLTSAHQVRRHLEAFGCRLFVRDPSDFLLNEFTHVEDANPHTISWYRRKEHLRDLGGVFIAHDDLSIDHGANIVAYHPNPRMILRKVIHILGGKVDQHPHIGSGCVIHPSAVLGADGENYEWIEGAYEAFPHVGGLHIGDRVDIGPCCTIMRGCAGNTLIGDGTKIGNAVNIGHDTRVGKNVLIVAHASIAGWVRIEDGAKIWQGALLKNGIHIGKDARIGMGSVVICDVPAGETWAGNPARKLY